MSVTDDYKALRGVWEQETQVNPCASLEGMVRRTATAARDTLAMAEGLRFSAWLNTLRDLADRQAAEREAVHAAWLELLRDRGILGPEEVTE